MRFLITISCLLFILNSSFASLAVETVTSKTSFTERKLNNSKSESIKEKGSITFQKVKKFLKALPEEVAKTDSMAIAGFICGLISLLVAGIILGTLGVIFSAIALSRISKNPAKKGQGLAIAGLLLGIIGAIGALVFLSKIM